MNRSILPRAQAPSGIKDRPFQASWECVFGAQEKDVYTGALYRDSAGRMRFEVRSPQREEMIIIRDQIRGELNILQPATHEGIRESFRNGSSSLMTWAFSNAHPCYTEDRKVIQGIRCRRVVLRDLAGADAGETWISHDYFLVMIDTGPVDGILRDWRVVELDLGEPAAELFVVPLDYRVSQSP